MEFAEDFIVQNLKFYRKEAGLTQAEFAAKIGVHPFTVSVWERRICKPQPRKTDKIMAIFAECFTYEFPVPDNLILPHDGKIPSGSVRTICPHCKSANHHFIETPIPRLEIKCITCGCEFRPFDKGPGPTKSHPAPGSNNKKKGNWNKWDRAKETR
jgi:DNA-binding XRE family transcriptional regulator